MNIVFVDIETRPNLAYVWGKYEQTALAYENQGCIVSFAAKSPGVKKVTCKMITDYPNFAKNELDDSALMKDLWTTLDFADLVIWHNGDKFDYKKSNTRLLKNGIPPYSPFKTIDTLKVARKEFAFNSNKLGDLADFLGIGHKVQHGGFDLWMGCIRNEEKAWRLMRKYNSWDVVLLEEVYMKLRPWIKNHPNITLDNPGPYACPKCGSLNVKFQKWVYLQSYRKKLYHCLSPGCGAWSRGGIEKIAVPVLT